MAGRRELAATGAHPPYPGRHTHKPWVHEYGGVLFVNWGSVGKPKDGDPRAAFAVAAAPQPARYLALNAIDAQTDLTEKTRGR